MTKKNPHAGHRARMRKRFLQTGFDAFEPHEVLEMLLFYVVPMKNTSVLAHDLLDRFGSISALLDAPIDALREAGLSESQAVFFKMLPETARVYSESKSQPRQELLDAKLFRDYLLSKFIGRMEEVLVLFLLDAKGKEIFSGVIATGNLDSLGIPVRKIVDLSLRYNARSAIIAHNHPSGVALPSKQDISATDDVSRALALVNVTLLDHFVVAEDDFVAILNNPLFR